MDLSSRTWALVAGVIGAVGTVLVPSSVLRAWAAAVVVLALGALTRAVSAARADVARADARRSGLDEVLDHLADGLVVIDDRRDVVRINRVACHLLGTTPEAAVGRLVGADVVRHVDRLGRIVSEGDLPSVRALRGEEIDDELFGIVLADGSRRWTHACSRLLPGQGGPGQPYAIITISDVTSRVDNELATEAETAQLRHRALHDGLTGLPNRTMLMDRLANARKRATLHGTATGLVVIDLDGFKTVNDTMGHAAGDEVLVQVAVRLRTTLRGSDTAARLGGDEFVVLCEDLSADTADVELAAISTRIQALLDEPYTTTAGAADIGASLGSAVARAGEELDLDLVVAADEAMLSDKRERRVHRSSTARPALAPVPATARDRLSVYIVDDDPAMRLLASRILESSGTSLEVVGEAQDGAEAIEEIIARAPDLVLCDVMMPRMSGPQVVTAVREQRPAQRFIFWSATSAPELERYEQDLGVPFVLKDRIEELPEVLLEVSQLITRRNAALTAQGGGSPDRP